MGPNILVRVGWAGGFTVIIMQVSVQIGLNLTGLELSLAILGVEVAGVNLTSSPFFYYKSLIVSLIPTTAPSTPN